MNEYRIIFMDTVAINEGTAQKSHCIEIGITQKEILSWPDSSEFNYFQLQWLGS